MRATFKAQSATLITRLSRKELFYRQAPTLVGALVIAELFYKWHSFLLEAGGFLLTWFLLDLIAAVVAKVLGADTASAPER